MKLVGIIPSRYHSTRFPGKALADLNGRPLFSHIYVSAADSGIFDEIYLATDSLKIEQTCRELHVPVLQTSPHHTTPTSRLHEVSEQIHADFYFMLGGDEPLIRPEDIRSVAELLLKSQKEAQAPFVINAMTTIQDISEALDPSNIKVVCNEKNEGLYLSRSPLPFPQGDLNISYKKFVSIGVYSKEALDFFMSFPQSQLERTEGCDLLRFLEHHKHILFTDIGHRTLSVDTPKDLEQVKKLLHVSPAEEFYESSNA